MICSYRLKKKFNGDLHLPDQQQKGVINTNAMCCIIVDFEHESHLIGVNNARLSVMLWICLRKQFLLLSFVYSVKID